MVVSAILLLLSTFCATVPMVVFLALVWYLDRYDREPVWLYGLTFFWGAIGAIFGALVLSGVALLPVEIIAPGMASSVGAVVVAPLAEEPSKAFILLLIFGTRYFDNATDGFVYGAASGLGFGMTENFLYFSEVAMSGDPLMWFGTVVVRTLYSAVMHASATAIVGAALGLAKFRGVLAVTAAGVVGLAIAMGVHALWNGLLTLDVATGGSGIFTTANFLVFPLEVLTVFAVFQVCLWDEKRTIRSELADEAAEGLIPKEHPFILSSWMRRRRRAWLPKGVDHHRYVQATTTLALRKRQAKLSKSPFYEDEVKRLRRLVSDILGRGEQAA